MLLAPVMKDHSVAYYVPALLMKPRFGQVDYCYFSVHSFIRSLIHYSTNIYEVPGSTDSSELGQNPKCHGGYVPVGEDREQTRLLLIDFACSCRQEGLETTVPTEDGSLSH